jgi:23S rRNA pseudouridine1911/1915/1917 synthase
MDPVTEPAIFFTVDEDSDGIRIDRFLAERIRECSRTFLQRMIDLGNVSLNGGTPKSSSTLKAGDKITVTIVENQEERLDPVPEDIPLDIIWEDADLVVVNKPAGMASHPSFGHTTGTLVNALLFHVKQLSDTGAPVRPGIVHRLDLDTTGLLVVAKNNHAHWKLADQFRQRETYKEYRAIVHGVPNPPTGNINMPIGRNYHDRKKMRTRRDGKDAETEYRTLERYGKFSFLALKPRTGRTHQLRVHLASRGNPIICDAMYGREIEAGAEFLRTGKRVKGEEPIISRQALHAARLSFRHPATGAISAFEAPLPADFQRALNALALT